MNWAIDHGYAFYWGTSEWTAQQITEAWDVAHRLDLIGPAMEQPEYNLLAREKVVHFFCPLCTLSCGMPDVGKFYLSPVFVETQALLLVG